MFVQELKYKNILQDLEKQKLFIQLLKQLKSFNQALFVKCVKLFKMFLLLVFFPIFM